jgi:hypothetical protein
MMTGMTIVMAMMMSTETPARTVLTDTGGHKSTPRS